MAGRRRHHRLQKQSGIPKHTQTGKILLHYLEWKVLILSSLHSVSGDSKISRKEISPYCSSGEKSLTHAHKHTCTHSSPATDTNDEININLLHNKEPSYITAKCHLISTKILLALYSYLHLTTCLFPHPFTI